MQRKTSAEIIGMGKGPLVLAYQSLPIEAETMRDALLKISKESEASARIINTARIGLGKST